MWEASSQRHSMRTRDTTLNQPKVRRFSIQSKSKEWIKKGQKGGKIFYPITKYIYTSVFTTVLRHMYRILLKGSILCLYVGSALFIRAFPFTPHFDGHDVLSESKTCLTNLSILDGDDSGVEDSQNSSISKKSWVVAQHNLWVYSFFIF